MNSKGQEEDFIIPIVDLIVELGKERKEIDCPIRKIYAVSQEVNREVGKRMEEARRIKEVSQHD